MNFSILTGDVVEVLPTLEANSFDAALCDPPYGLEFMGKEWDRLDTAHAKRDRSDELGVESKRPFLAHSVSYQHGTPAQTWHHAWATSLLRVLKPGAMLLAFGGTRTHHRLMCALEDAGLEIRDTLCWLYGSGFPKSLDISKAIDKAAGAEREVWHTIWGPVPGNLGGGGKFGHGTDRSITAPATDLVRRWSGYGTALKPAWEPCIVAMKPLDGTFAHNAQKWGVAGINVDGSRIGWAGPEDAAAAAAAAAVGYSKSMDAGRVRAPTSLPSTYKKPPYEPDKITGRWPANVILGCGCEKEESWGLKSESQLSLADVTTTNRPEPAPITVENTIRHSLNCAVALLDRQSEEGGMHGAGVARAGSHSPRPCEYSASSYKIPHSTGDMFRLGDSGGASRFFYTAKVSTAEREGSDHPTMKPIDLTRYLAKLILPPQRETPRRIVVPFAGVGSEMIGAILAGWDEVVGIEKDEAYAAKARERIVGTAPLFLTAETERADVPAPNSVERGIR